MKIDPVAGSSVSTMEAEARLVGKAAKAALRRVE
jgi:hypothetical protein